MTGEKRHSCPPCSHYFDLILSGWGKINNNIQIREYIHRYLLDLWVYLMKHLCSFNTSEQEIISRGEIHPNNRDSNKLFVLWGGGEMGSMYVLSYQLCWYVHISTCTYVGQLEWLERTASTLTSFHCPRFAFLFDCCKQSFAQLLTDKISSLLGFRISNAGNEHVFYFIFFIPCQRSE